MALGNMSHWVFCYWVLWHWISWHWVLYHIGYFVIGYHGIGYYVTLGIFSLGIMALGIMARGIMTLAIMRCNPPMCSFKKSNGRLFFFTINKQKRLDNCTKIQNYQCINPALLLTEIDKPCFSLLNISFFSDQICLKGC